MQTKLQFGLRYPSIVSKSVDSKEIEGHNRFYYSYVSCTQFTGKNSSLEIIVYVVHIRIHYNAIIIITSQGDITMGTVVKLASRRYSPFVHKQRKSLKQLFYPSRSIALRFIHLTINRFESYCSAFKIAATSTNRYRLT